VQCCPLPTALLSAPANYEGCTLLGLTGEMPRVLRHLRSLGTRFDAVYSGFLADGEQAHAVEEAFAAFPDALRVVDPVLGDNGKLYRTTGAPTVDAVRRLAAQAHIITPNVTEAAVLLGKDAGSAPAGEADAKAWLNALTADTPRSAVLTGLTSEKRGEAVVGWAKKGASGLIRHQRTAVDYPGAGDLFTSRLLAEMLYGAPLSAAVKTAALFVRDCAAFTAGRGADPKEGLLFEGVLRT
jgi:pyridoxine kinase